MISSEIYPIISNKYTCQVVESIIIPLYEYRNKLYKKYNAEDYVNVGKYDVIINLEKDK